MACLGTVDPYDANGHFLAYVLLSPDDGEVGRGEQVIFCRLYAHAAEGGIARLAHQAYPGDNGYDTAVGSDADAARIERLYAAAGAEVEVVLLFRLFISLLL